MAVPPQEYVQQVLSDFEQRLRRVVDAAWHEWTSWPDRSRVVFVGRFRAVFVFDAIARHALAEFGDDKNIHVIIERQTIQFMFKNEVLVRFKKGNRRGVGSNIETQAVLNFVDPQRTIPGLIPEIMRVEICYMPDELGVNLDEVAVVARDRYKRAWHYRLDRETPAVVPMPQRAPDESRPTIVPRQSQPDEEKTEQ